MKSITDLESMGYTFSLEGDRLRYHYAASVSPPPEAAALLDELRQRKTEAVAYLKRRAVDFEALNREMPLSLVDLPAFCDRHGLTGARVHWAGDKLELEVMAHHG